MGLDFSVSSTIRHHNVPNEPHRCEGDHEQHLQQRERWPPSRWQCAAPPWCRSRWHVRWRASPSRPCATPPHAVFAMRTRRHSSRNRRCPFFFAPVRCSPPTPGAGSRLATCVVAHRLTLMRCARVQSVVPLDPKLDACVAYSCSRSSAPCEWLPGAV